MKRIIGHLLMVVVAGTTAGGAQIPPEVAENRCEGKAGDVACWQRLANHPECYFWAYDSNPVWIVNWTGECSEGLAQGKGTLEWRSSNGYLLAKHTGNLKDGKYHGKWEEDQTYGGRTSYYHGRGSYVEGVRHGHWYEYYGRGYSDEGPYVDGKRHGLWTEDGRDGRRRVSKGLYVEGKKHGPWTVETKMIVVVGADKFPFIQALQRLGTPEEKLQHLKSWQPRLAKENGISRYNAYRYAALLDLYVFPSVGDEGVVDCKALEDDLMSTLRERLEITEAGYVMFNYTVDEVCPGIDPGD